MVGFRVPDSVPEIIQFFVMDLQTVKYPPCPNASHASEPLSRLCLDPSCKQRVPVCCICEFEDHQGHNTIPIVHVLRELHNSGQKLAPVEGALQLASLRKHFFDSVTALRREVLDHLSDLESKVEIYFNSCEEKLLGFYELGQPLSNQAQQDPKQYQRFFSRLLTLIPTENKKDFVLTNKVAELLTSFQEKEKKLTQGIAGIQTSFRKSLAEVETLLGRDRVYDARWSETLKGAKVKIEGLLASQTGMESSGQRFCLMEEPLSESKRTQWAITVKKFVGWVGLGVCLKEMIKGGNYHFNHGNIGHGSYLISTNGYTWSHSQKEFNSTSKCFSFTTNDTVYIEYDPLNRKIRFRKNQGKDPKEQYELDIVVPPSGDAYHPCVNLCSSGDSVELLYPGVPLS